MGIVKLTARLAALMIVGLSAGAQAADLGGLPERSHAPRERAVEALGPNCNRVWTCHGDLCQWKRVCWRGCPDRYSCAPLYGAYGPYGGPSYWAAYSYGDMRNGQ